MNKNEIWKKWEKFANFDIFIASAALLILIFIAFIGVIARYILNRPIPWQQEIQILCYIWMAYFGVCAVVRNGGHVAIDILIDALPRKLGTIIEKIDYVIYMAVLLFTAYYGYRLVLQLFMTNRVSGVLDIPYWLFYLPMPIGMVLTIVNSTVMLITKGYYNKPPEQVPGEAIINGTGKMEIAETTQEEE